MAKNSFVAEVTFKHWRSKSFFDLKTSLEICYLGVFEKTVKVMGQNKASHNLLKIK